MRRTWLLPLALLLCLTACGTTGEDASAAPSTDPGAGSRSAPATATGAPSTALAGTASCTDATGDGGQADLVGVDLASGTAAGLQVTYRLASPLDTSTGTALLALTAWSEAGDVGRQLGLKWIDGQASLFSFDLVGAKQENLTAAPMVAGSTVTVSFPTDAVAPLGSFWKWSATTSVNGQDQDTCPEAGDDVLNPSRLTFPG